MSYCIKIESPEHSEKVQKYMFSLGYDWHRGLRNVQCTNKPYLVFDAEQLLITWCDDVSFHESILDLQDVELVETFKLIKVENENV